VREIPSKISGSKFGAVFLQLKETSVEHRFPNRSYEMKKAAIAMTVALAVGTSSGAFAKDMTGTITSIDKKGDAITLSDGQTLKLPEGVEAERLTVGEQVRITFTAGTSGKIHVSHIQPVAPRP
jgi:hypothetical protein